MATKLLFTRTLVVLGILVARGFDGQAPRNREAGYSDYFGWELLLATKLLVSRTLVILVISVGKGFWQPGSE